MQGLAASHLTTISLPPSYALRVRALVPHKNGPNNVGLRCPSLALTSLIGSLGISSLVDCRQLCFINFIARMSTNDLPKRILMERLLLDTVSGLLKTIGPPYIASTHSFPPISAMVSYGKIKTRLKAAANKFLLIGQ